MLLTLRRSRRVLRAGGIISAADGGACSASHCWVQAHGKATGTADPSYLFLLPWLSAGLFRGVWWSKGWERDAAVCPVRSPCGAALHPALPVPPVPCRREPAQLPCHSSPWQTQHLRDPCTAQPCHLHSALVLGWKHTQGGKRIRRAMGPPKRNFSKTGETQDLGSSIIIYDKRWG